MNQTPAARKAIHHRRVECTGYLRDDGLWDIEGRIIDTKTYERDSKERIIPAGEPMHDMFLQLTVDDQFLVRDLVARTDASPFASCPGCNHGYRQLIGMHLIGAGFSQKARELFRGARGCTHITELLGPVATTAYQTIATWHHDHENLAADPRLLDSCHGFRRDGEVVKLHFAELLERPDA